MHEMKVALATLLHRFEFRVHKEFEPNLEIERFGVFLTLCSTNGVRLMVARRAH
jgi:hypothetical protein